MERYKADTSKGHGVVKAPIEVKRDLSFQKPGVREYLLAGRRNNKVEKLCSMIQPPANGYLTFKDGQVSKVKLGSGELSSPH